jgi:hypothetical protein
LFCHALLDPSSEPVKLVMVESGLQRIETSEPPVRTVTWDVSLVVSLVPAVPLKILIKECEGDSLGERYGVDV